MLGQKRKLQLTIPGPKRVCEFCYSNLPRDVDVTVCDACDEAMKAQYAEEDSARAKRHAAKYKCKRCGDGLPLDRRFTCLPCYRLAEERGELTVMKVSRSHPDYKPELVPEGEKQCTDCLQTKQLSEFYKQATTADKLMYRCKECQKYRVRTHQKREEVNELFQVQ